ncbi:MAG: LytR C-terminal domain-containing protein [Microbacteriaceae bacterium]|nr:LytR C-terminal domain-containing protein [Microbacteriaceae bacterium]
MGERNEANTAKAAANLHDRFDEVPRKGGSRGQTGGVHRRNPRKRYIGRWIAIVVVGTLICSLAGVLWLTKFGGEEQFSSSKKQNQQVTEKKPQNPQNSGQQQAPQSAPQPAPAPAPTPAEVEPKLDPQATVTVLNGKGVPRLAAVVLENITRGEWGAAGPTQNAPEQVAKSTVFYTDKKDEAAAKALAEKLKITDVKLDKEYAKYETKIVVLLGADYVGPGA